MEVGHEEDGASCSCLERSDVESITSKGRREHLAVDKELGWEGGIPRDLLADGGALAGVVPVEVEGDEDLQT